MLQAARELRQNVYLTLREGRNFPLTVATVTIPHSLQGLLEDVGCDEQLNTGVVGKLQAAEELVGAGDVGQS